MSLKTLARDCTQSNPPGVKATVYAVLADDIETYPSLKATTAQGDSVTLDGDIVLKAGKEWAALQMQVKNSKLRSAKTGERGAGGGFDNIFEGFLPGMTPIEMEAVDCLNSPCGYVFAVPQKNGFTRIIGEPEEPAFADTLDSDTGLTGEDKAGTVIVIGAEYSKPAPFYEGTITPINAPA